MQRFKLSKFAAAFVLATALAAVAAAQSTGIKGRVRDPDGRAIGSVEVTARQEGKVIASARTASDGRFTLPLTAGTYNIAFDAAGYNTGVKYNVEVKRNDVRDLGSNLVLARDRGTLILVAGLVLDKDDLSVRGAAVDLYIVNSDGSARKLQTVLTNDAGEFAFHGISSADKVRVKASAKGVSAEAVIDVDQPQVYRTVLRLPFEHEKK